MPKNKDTQDETADGVLVTAAKTVGKAAAKIASVVSRSSSRSSKNKGTRPVKKKKTGLPRKAKKAAKKAAQLKT
jgi:hypothetical protein